MAREFHGKIPRVPIDADTSKADAKIDRLFQKIDGLKKIDIDADVNQAQRRLETMAKRTNEQLSKNLINTMVKDFKTVLGAMKTEYESFGTSSNIYKNLEKTCDMVEERFSNMTISVNKKSISGLENILNRASELQSMDSFSFDTPASKQVVKNVENTLSKIKESRKEINSIVSKVEYIQKTLDKGADGGFSTKKLEQYKEKIEGLRKSLQGFYDIDDELIQNALLNAASKINEALGTIDIKMPKVKVGVDALSTGETVKNLASLEKKSKAIEEVTSRISKNSSINGLKNLEQEAVNVTKVLAKMYDDGIVDTERFITLQYKLSKIFDKMGKGYGGVKHSGAKDKAGLIDLVVDGIAQKTGINLFSDKRLSGVMDSLFGSSDFSLFNKSLSKLGMKDIAEVLLVTGKAGDWADMQKRVAAEVENTTDVIKKEKDELQELSDVFESTEEIMAKSKKKHLGKDWFAEIYDAKTSQEVIRVLGEIDEQIKLLEADAHKAKLEYDMLNTAILSYTGRNIGSKSEFGKAIKDAWANDEKEAAAKLFSNYQKRFPDGKFDPNKTFGAEWTDNYTKNLEAANRSLSIWKGGIKAAAEEYGKFLAYLALTKEYDPNVGSQGFKPMAEFYLSELQKKENETTIATEKAANLLTNAQNRFATDDLVKAQKNLNDAIDEYNAKLAESNRLYEEKCRIEDLDSYENEPWYKENELPANKIMEIARQFAEADDAVNDFKVSLKEAVRVYRELGGDMKLPFSDEALLQEIDIPVKVVPVVEKSKYYEIDEGAAKRAKDANSFSDYIPGSATKAYRQAIDELSAIVESKKKQFPDRAEELDRLLDTYAKRYAEYINKQNAIDASVPSVLVAGPAGIKQSQKDKQNQRRDANYKFFQEKVESLENKIRDIGTGAQTIRTDDDNALESLEKKVEELKKAHQIMVEANKYFRKHKTLDGFDKLSDELKKEVEQTRAAWGQPDMQPFPQYALQNSNQEIKRLEGRVKELKGLKDSEGLREINEFYSLITDKNDMRIRISFEMGRPDQEVIDMLKGKAFKWSPKNEAWQRQLTNNAVYDTKKLQESLHNYFKIDASSEEYKNIAKEVDILSAAYDEMSQRANRSFKFSEEYVRALDLVKKGALSAADAIKQLNEFIDVKSISAPVDPIEHLVNSLNKLESVGGKPFNEIVRSIAEGGATISSEVQDILKDLNLLNEAGQFTGNFITEGMNNSGVITNGKYAVIARTQEHYDEPESYEYDFKDGTTYIDNLIAKEKEAAEQGVNLARVLARVKSEVNTGEDLFYEIQEFAPGDQLHIFSESKKNIQDFEQECAKIVGASREHIEKLMSDLIKLNELGFYIDLSPANILYDATEGFKFIDLSLRDLGTSAQTTTELMSGLFTCLTALEDSGDRISSDAENSMRWQTAMLSVYNKLSTVFGQNNFGADFSSVMSDFYGSLSEYAGFTDNLSDSNKKLASSYEEVAEAVEEAAEEQKKLFKAPKNNYEKLFNTLALGDNAYETKTKGNVSGYSWSERETIAEAIIQGLRQGVDKIDIVLNNGKTTLTFAGGLDSAARILDMFGFKAIESEFTKFIGRAIKTGSNTMYQSSDKGNYIVDATQLFKLSRPLNEMEYGRLGEYREKDLSSLLRGAENATANMPVNVREALIDIPDDKKGRQEKHYIFKTEDGQYLVLKKSAFDNIRKVSSNVKYNPNGFKNGLYTSMVYGFGENGDVVSAMVSRIKGLFQTIGDIFNSSLPVKTDFSLPNKNVLNIAGVTSEIVDKKQLVQIDSKDDKKVDKVDEISLEEFNKRAEEIYNNLRKHMSALDASNIIGDITKSVNENLISTTEGLKQIEDRYASWSAKQAELSQRTSETSNNIRAFNDALKDQLEAVAGNPDAIKEYSNTLSEIGSGAISAADAINRMQNEFKKYDSAPGDASFVPYRIDKQQASNIVDSRIDKQTIDEWYLSKADHKVRDELGQLAMSDDELRNATLNLLFEAYVSRGGKLNFHDFVNSDTTIYRGTSKQNEDQSVSGKFTSFTLDQGVAENFANNLINGTGDKMVVAIETKIKDVVGLFNDSLSSELELFVPRDKINNVLLDNETKVSSAVDETLKAKQKQSEIASKIVEKTEAQATAEEKVAEAAEKVSETLNDTKGSDNVSVEEIVERNINEALAQLRSAKDNETTLFSLKGVFEGDDLVDQAQAMIQNIAEQANLSVSSFTVKDDIIKVKLYNDELKITVDQMYKLKAATEEMDSAQLRLESQSFSQNVKALTENKFDVEGVQQRALAAVEKVRASLHGLEYDLTDLENAAKNIESQDAFNKFNNQLKAAQDNIQAIKNSTVSKNSMNPLANMQRDMQNASIEIETMRLKLEKFGDIKGVSDAKKMLEDMTAAVKQYNEASNAQGQQAAYNQYSNLRSSFKAQTEYINAAKTLNDSQKSEAHKTDPIKSQYQSILELVNKINTANERMVKFQQMDGGSGLLGKQMQGEINKKAEAVAKLQTVLSELKIGEVLGSERYTLPDDIASIGTDYSQISAFINDAGVQASLTTAEIEKLVKSLVKASDIDLSMLSEALGNESIKARAKQVSYENQYFTGKQKYSADLNVDDIQKLGTASDSTKEKLEGMAQAIAQNSEGAVALTKNFSMGADGIAKLDFSILDTNTGSIKDFTIALGTATGQVAVFDTTVDKSVKNVQNARNQMEAAKNVIGRLGFADVTAGDTAVPQQIDNILAKIKQLNGEIAKGDGADQNNITRYTKDLQLLVKEAENADNKMRKMESAIANNTATYLGNADPNGNIYTELTRKAQEFAASQGNVTLELGRFDEANKTLNASLTHANGTVEQFKVSMYGLNGQCAAQQTGVGKLTNTWDRFKTTLGTAGKHLVTAFAGYNVFYKAIAEVRKGIGYVKEIDLALTELKKVTDETEASYAKFLDTAAGTAGKIGSTLSDFTEATANFARLGYTMEESANMAETAIVYKNVADGLDTVDEATDSIISTMKAFGIESNDTMSIIDRFNEVGNRFAITSAGIGEALQRSASALYAGGNTIDESIALVTAANSVWLWLSINSFNCWNSYRTISS